MQENPKILLQQHWGHQDFRGSQDNIITALLAQKDVIALLPTGGGKSICYQIPALAQEGICIVVSPLIALIQDQINNLKEKGVKCAALIGGMSFEELDHTLDNCIYGGYKFLYLSPERLQQSLVQERIAQMQVNLIAVDEAHCISEWGQDFRPAYLKCNVLRQLHPITPIIALTATATPKVVNDITNHLELRNVSIFKDSFARKNIAFHVLEAEDKFFQLKHLLTITTGSAIVYTRTRKSTLEISNYLKMQGIASEFFHGGLSQSDKTKKLKHFLQNDIRVMVATNAFGMGVDKPDVRLVIHYQIPDSLENYFQEAGRAGRDGNPAAAYILTSEDAISRTKNQFLTNLPEVDFLKLLFRKLCSFLLIAYGEGSGQTYGLDLNAFCEQYQLRPGKVYAGLQMLDQNSVLLLSQNYKVKTSIQFICTKERVFQWLDNHPSLTNVVQSILRTYGGIFEYETTINPQLISKKSEAVLPKVMDTLKKLAQDQIITYTAAQEDLSLQFLVPREDDLTINTFAKKIKQLNATKTYKLQQMLAYLEQQKICRQSYVLDYFGEKKVTPCGTCDVCRQQNKTVTSLKRQIYSILKKQALTSRELVGELNATQSEILLELQQLLEDGYVTLQPDNRYGVYEQKKKS
ncbi:ATP-dependent DNA helicase RecQ [Flavobacterium sp. ASW18X]|uniref:RecQ family ATP-dependent DNA helicase n=1 Tax=Flavobacterium sp. ASW18X TaxID=2572595 RepID=UPI0010ADE450|nr:RecQ family ATP-dependent DNA helicase [Flavobacterium sp. ASW18X]TKD66256.1 RecQ family ATP-dependent DNA helicase [Flavobacterium sp. ASW18X]